ncbi:MAG TPA: acylphosphatase [Terriglobales bacterium]|jgi:acylphosphatase
MSRNSPIARRYVVHGRVQGVGFRYFVEREAQQLSLAGYVKNRADGTVEVYACGVEEKMGELKRRLWKGPSLARVDNVEEQECEAAGRLGFRVEF